MAGRHSFLHFSCPPSSAQLGSTLPRKAQAQLVRAAALAAVAAGLIGLLGTRGIASADHFMCGSPIERRTQTVSIDPYLDGTGVSREDVLAAFQPWNELFLKYHGFPIFADHIGDWWEADILLTAQGWPRTWVATRCIQGYVPRGANHSIVFIGRDDAWRNRLLLPHELGHALGFGDHGMAAEHSDGHIGLQPCSIRYIGVMSYCTSVQAWFLDIEIQGVLVDGQLVQGYWQREPAH